MLVFALVSTEGFSNSVVSKIKSLGEEIKSINLVYGEYDMVVRVVAFNKEKMSEKIKQISDIEEVSSIKVLTALDKTKETDVV